ncbi:MAG: FtsX-like permease family protein [Bdellovibrionota bacterium]
MKLLKLSLVEIIRSWKFSLSFILSLSLGLSGFLIIESYRDALRFTLNQNSKSLLSADIAVSARRLITPQELKQVRKIISDSAEDFLVPEMPYFEFMAMMTTSKGSRLVTVKGISDSYPYYGELGLRGGQKITENTPKDIKKKNIWISNDLESQLAIGIGEEVTLGKLKLKVSQIVDTDSSQTFRAALMVPAVYMYVQDVKATGLIQYGSTFNENYLYKFPQELSNREYLAKVQEKLYAALKDPAVRVSTPQTASEGSGRQLDYLFDFLGLVAIVALFLSCLGATYLFRLYLSRKYKQIAIYRTLGIYPGQIFVIYSFQVLILSALTLVPAIAFAQLFIPVFKNLLSTLTPFELKAIISQKTFLTCLGISLLGSFLSILPKLIGIQSLKPMKLFSEEKFSTEPSKTNLLLYIPLTLFYMGLSVMQANSWKVGLSFVGTIGGVMLLMVIIGLGLFKCLEGVSFIKRWYLKYSFLALSRKKGASMAVFVAIGLGALLINLLPQLKYSLQREFEIGTKTPSLFLFDIQDDQLEPLKNFVKSQGTALTAISPMIRSRILKINDEDYERKVETQTFKTREEEQEARSRNRGVNLSYRENLSESEELVEGEFFTTKYDAASNAPFGLSLEQRYADRMGIKMGDKVVFDIQGVELVGVVQSIRSVKWISFQPNFFILFQEGVLEEAPKTFIAAIPAMDLTKKNELRNALAVKYNNISSIDVTRLVDSTLKISDQMSWSLELMSLLALLSGYIVLFSIIRSHLETRYYEINMLKVFGGSFWKLTGYILNEYITLTLLASTLGVFFSVLVSYGISYYLFEGIFTLKLSTLITSVSLITMISAIVCFLASFKIFKSRPSDVLRAD